ncbi:MAG TPA: ATP-grasp domain-containing protein, partial [Herpetosiphonaceae bacterium]|nr:ATP-grasp domain-containing protein [Herpetosiphonaceae bacterium]
PEQYGRLYAALLRKGWRLINDPAAYRHCHYLPESLEIIAAHTPRTIWLPLDGPPDFAALMNRLAVFGSAPLILKDYVKSRKHDWDTACFIPAADDAARVRSVVERFIALQGADLNEGLVFREFVDFQPLAAHPKSGMPLTREFRAFWADGRPICVTPYWDEVAYDSAGPPLDRFAELAGRVRSRFWTMDLAQRPDGSWMIVELGDGQVAGLPENADPAAFLAALASAAG